MFVDYLGCGAGPRGLDGYLLPRELGIYRLWSVELYGPIAPPHSLLWTSASVSISFASSLYETSILLIAGLGSGEFSPLFLAMPCYIRR